MSDLKIYRKGAWIVVNAGESMPVRYRPDRSPVERQNVGFGNNSY
jgi:hypothetical protein